MKIYNKTFFNNGEMENISIISGEPNYGKVDTFKLVLDKRAKGEDGKYQSKSKVEIPMREDNMFELSLSINKFIAAINRQLFKLKEEVHETKVIQSFSITLQDLYELRFICVCEVEGDKRNIIIRVQVYKFDSFDEIKEARQSSFKNAKEKMKKSIELPRYFVGNNTWIYQSVAVLQHLSRVLETASIGDLGIMLASLEVDNASKSIDDVSSSSDSSDDEFPF